MRSKRKLKAPPIRKQRRQAETEAIDGPAVVTALHRQDRVLGTAPGAAKGFRRIDRLQWLADHKAIGDHQLYAGRRLQADWQTSKIEASARMGFGGGGGIPGSLSDAALEAGRRVKNALAVLPAELVTLTTLFLLPEDHPFSLERVAAMVKEDRRAAAYGIRIALSLLARFYGYG
jgi:hypothetical protein